MTGNELKVARSSSGVTQRELANRIGVSWQTIGQWERMGDEDVLAPKPRETAATKRAKERLVPQFRYMDCLGIFQRSVEGLGQQIIEPAPHDWPFYVLEGEPLILTLEPAVPGDLILVRDSSHQLSRMGRVTADKLNGQGDYLVRYLGGLVQPMPDKEQYLTVAYYLHRSHDGIPDIPIVEKLDNLPGDMT